MNKILFSAYCTCTTHKALCEGVVEMMTQSGHTVCVLSNTPLNTNAQSLHIEQKCMTEYDVAISFGRRGYSNMCKYMGYRNIPHIYMLAQSDWMSEYIDSQKYDHILSIMDSVYRMAPIYLKNNVTKIGLPFILPNAPLSDYPGATSRILVNISDTDVLLNILPVLNGLHHNMPITIVGNYRFKNLFNPNIEYIHASIDTNDLIKKSSIIIGNGHTVLAGLLQCKPVVIVGCRGLGGLVTKENIATQYCAGFHGRVGAEKGEFVPAVLLEREIKKGLQFIDKRNEEQLAVVSFLAQAYQRNVVCLNQLLMSVIKQKKESWTLLWEKNPSFDYQRIGNNSYIVTNMDTNKMLFSIRYEECQIIEYFTEPATPQDVFNKSKYGNIEAFREFIDQLIFHRILYYHEA